jgi:N utilization substance protein A
MESINLIDTFSEFRELKSIDRTTMMSVLEDVFRSVLIKRFGTDENFDVIINVDKGDFEIWRNRVVVADGEVDDSNLQIPLTQAKMIDEDYEIHTFVAAESHLPDTGIGERPRLQ